MRQLILQLANNTADVGLTDAMEALVCTTMEYSNLKFLSFVVHCQYTTSIATPASPSGALVLVAGMEFNTVNVCLYVI